MRRRRDTPSLASSRISSISTELYEERGASTYMFVYLHARARGPSRLLRHPE
jgi:hypothetical protein